MAEITATLIKDLRERTGAGMSDCKKALVEVNGDLATHPEAVNARPHETWMIRIRASQPGEADALLDAEAYSKLTA